MNWDTRCPFCNVNVQYWSNCSSSTSIDYDDTVKITRRNRRSIQLLHRSCFNVNIRYMQDVTVRLMKDEEFNKVCTIYNKCTKDSPELKHLTRTQFKDAFVGYDKKIIAITKGTTLVGALTYTILPEGVQITSMFITPDYRDRYLGEKLLSSFLSSARLIMRDEIFVYVNTHNYHIRHILARFRFDPVSEKRTKSSKENNLRKYVLRTKNIIW